MAESGAKPAAEAATGSRLLDLVRVMDILRVNCPWDARQTHESLMPYLLEETYEAVDALATGDQAAVREELGDVLLQVVFHARVAQERADGTGYTIDDVADGIIDKLTRRHPHVFGDVSVSGPDEVKLNWDAIKAAERAAAGASGPASVLDGVPLSQPALSLAAQLLRRAERAGVPAELAEGGSSPATAPESNGGASPATAPESSRRTGPATSPESSRGSAPAATPESNVDAAQARAGAARPDQAGIRGEGGELGRELFALVNRARAAGLDPELELRGAALAYADRVRAWAASQDWQPAEQPPDDLR